MRTKSDWSGCGYCWTYPNFVTTANKIEYFFALSSKLLCDRGSKDKIRYSLISITLSPASHTQTVWRINTKLRSIDIERFTPKFLKNWEPQLFQKVAGIGSRRLIPICIPMNANWYYSLCYIRGSLLGQHGYRIITAGHQATKQPCCHKSKTRPKVPSVYSDKFTHWSRN